MNFKKIIISTLSVSLLAISVPALASLIDFKSTVGSFTYNSASTSAAYRAAQGPTTEHISFNTATNTNGAAYSSNVIFSSKVGAAGGSNTGSVSAQNEIGPSSGWNGILDIDFLAAGNTVSAVGFGLVEAGEIIRIYDQSNVLMATFTDVLPTMFSFWGVATTAGERIGRVELDGRFFAIQDIQFSTNTVPEPASMALFALGLLGLGIARRQKQ
ncbi:MAG: PEP-CTERM sorting domain-containing protein [Pseudomonadota bacterium]